MQQLYGVYAWMTFIAVTVPTICLLAITPGLHARRVLAKKAAALILFVTGVTPQVRGLENLPAERCVVAANHASYLDGLILTAVLPPHFTFIIKQEMSHVPVAAFLLRRIGSQFVERFDKKRGAIDARRILQLARAGHSLAFFPEGTFRREPGLRRFHSGAFVAAKRGKLNLVPVVIHGSRAMLPAHQALPTRERITVIVKQAITPNSSGSSTAELISACRDSILEDLNEPDTLLQLG